MAYNIYEKIYFIEAVKEMEKKVSLLIWWEEKDEKKEEWEQEGYSRNQTFIGVQDFWENNETYNIIVFLLCFFSLLRKKKEITTILTCLTLCLCISLLNLLSITLSDTFQVSIYMLQMDTLFWQPIKLFLGFDWMAWITISVTGDGPIN